MTLRRILPLLALFAAAFFAAPQAEALPPEPILRICSEICTPTSCGMTCRIPGQGTTTCGVYFGNPPNDYDSDGVPNGSDNCLCKANSNQANCDGDAFGNACDSIDNSWHQIFDPGRACHMDVDQHFGFESMEVYYQSLWKSNCTGATCTKKRLVNEFSCFPDVTESCCMQKWGVLNDCYFIWNSDQCGVPRCTF